METNDVAAGIWLLSGQCEIIADGGDWSFITLRLLMQKEIPYATNTTDLLTGSGTYDIVATEGCRQVDLTLFPSLKGNAWSSSDHRESEEMSFEWSISQLAVRGCSPAMLLWMLRIGIPGRS